MIDIDTYEEISAEVSGTSFVVDAPMPGVVIEGSKDISLLKGESSTLIARIIPDNTTETLGENTGIAEGY